MFDTDIHRFLFGIANIQIGTHVGSLLGFRQKKGATRDVESRVSGRAAGESEGNGQQGGEKKKNKYVGEHQGFCRSAFFDVLHLLEISNLL
jgi:hypothetical protein